MDELLIQETRKIYSEIFGGDREVETWGPGRVNLIGEHTDYNEGYVLPMALDKGLFLTGRRRTDGKVILYSADYRDLVEFHPENLLKDPGHPWADYFKGVLGQYQKKKPFKGCQAVLKGNLPQGAGLSSSASMEIAAAVFLEETNGTVWEDMELVRAARAAENGFVGVQCGIMDPFASYLGQKAKALFIDCRSLEFQPVSIPDGLKIVVCHTGVRRSLGESAYNRRRQECEEGIKSLSEVLTDVKSLRDVSLQNLEAHQRRLPKVIFERCRHVVTENRRVTEMVKALSEKKLARAGELLYESHESLRKDYEVSCPELDILVELAQKNPLVLGARMTGAGFGGCTLNLVRRESVEKFLEQTAEGYLRETGRKLESWVFEASDGAKWLRDQG